MLLPRTSTCKLLVKRHIYSSFTVCDATIDSVTISIDLISLADPLERSVPSGAAAAILFA